MSGLSSRTVPNSIFFFFNDTATTEIYTLSLHDALPISFCQAGSGTNSRRGCSGEHLLFWQSCSFRAWGRDRKSTRLNSSHQIISYAVFCLKKKKKKERIHVKQEVMTIRENVR